eukprot:2716167-Rhodomonas_salina.1
MALHQVRVTVRLQAESGCFHCTGTLVPGSRSTVTTRAPQQTTVSARFEQIETRRASRPSGTRGKSELECAVSTISCRAEEDSGSWERASGGGEFGKGGSAMMGAGGASRPVLRSRA